MVQGILPSYHTENCESCVSAFVNVLAFFCLLTTHRNLSRCNEVRYGESFCGPRWSVPAVQPFFTDEQHEEFCMHSERFLVCYNSLAAEAINGDKKLYNMLPKFHASTHHWHSRTNPRAVHCYADEDMVGRLKRIFITCHHSTAAKRALQRYAIVVCLRWWHAVHELRGIPRELFNMSHIYKDARFYVCVSTPFILPLIFTITLFWFPTPVSFLNAGPLMLFS